MPQVIYLGDEEVITVANGGAELVNHGDVLTVDDVTAGGLVGHGDGVWQYTDTPAPVVVDDTAAEIEEND